MMSSRRESHLPNFHRHHPNDNNNHDHHQDIPKGCVAIMVGQGEEQQRIIIPVGYINHPLFMQLLKEAEEEYGFDQKGTINIPCHLEEFRYVQGLIDKENHHHHHNHHLLQHHNSWCFRH
ncbi:auxin-responsive protein SAUR32-like [Cornus florida]|uniref:auxin-responsive protein SAUR32-like n=1 Tax=Cornus florida TaxID=4283 RepID=UPI0028A03453|nr:auxin-responsive protein SAUR32-like [Cornus florida]